MDMRALAELNRHTLSDIREQLLRDSGPMSETEIVEAAEEQYGAVVSALLKYLS